MDETKPLMGWGDICVFAGMLIASTVIGIYFGLRRQQGVSQEDEYLRGGKTMKVIPVAMSLVASFETLQILYIPIVIYVPAIALSQVTGINVHVITPITSLVCIFYTTLAILIVASQVAVLFLGIRKLGSWSHVWEVSDQGDRLQFFNMSPNPLIRHTFWTVLFGSYTGWLATMAVSQGMVQRYVSLPNIRAAKWSLFYFAWGLFLSNVLCMATGLTIYAEYANCDPLTTKRAERPDQLSPLYVQEIGGHIPGLGGLFVAGVFSAALSSMSMGMNASAGVIVEDLLSTVLPPVVSKCTWMRIFSTLIGVVCVLLVFVVERLGGVLQAEQCLVCFYSECFALVLPVSALVLGAQAAIASGSLRHQTLPMSVEGCPGNVTLPLPQTPGEVWPIFRLSYMYFVVTGTLLVLLVGVPASLVAGGEATKPEYLHPFARRLLPREENETVELKSFKRCKNTRELPSMTCNAEE
ncbi:hypothetical protein B566_EDAN009497 [Ephemera danica]|nr:hypothetical protein B566_EDAN009497 [Ephemera danica]